MDDYCRVALAAGMETLGFSDHCALPDGRWSSVRMEMSELDGYVAAVERGRRGAGRLQPSSASICAAQMKSFSERPPASCVDRVSVTLL